MSIFSFKHKCCKYIFAANPQCCIMPSSCGPNWLPQSHEGGNFSKMELATCHKLPCDLGSKREVQGLSGPVLDTMQNGPNIDVSICDKKSKPHWSSATSCTKHGISTSLAKIMKFGNVRNFSASGKKHQSQAVSTCKMQDSFPIDSFNHSSSISTIHG